MTCFWQLLKSNSIRFHWVPMDVRIFLLKNFVTNHLELQIILDYPVSHAKLNQFDLHISWKRTDTWGMDMSNAVTFGILRLGNRLDTVWTIELKVLLKMKNQEIILILILFSYSKKIAFSLLGDVPACFFHLLDAKCLKTHCTMSQTHSSNFFMSPSGNALFSLYR